VDDRNIDARSSCKRRNSPAHRHQRDTLAETLTLDHREDQRESEDQ